MHIFMYVDICIFVCMCIYIHLHISDILTSIFIAEWVKAAYGI